MLTATRSSAHPSGNTEKLPPVWPQVASCSGGGAHRWDGSAVQDFSLERGDLIREL